MNVTLTKERIEQAIAAVDDDVDITGDAYMSTEMKRHLAKHYLRGVIEELYKED